ncbi:MAG TPA: sigma-70 family RNA polymerase sigma factor [Streptosporangiaceae bacterium]
MSTSDAVLISRIRTGDPAAGDLLYERHAPAARVLARLLAGDGPAAEDAVVATFAQAFGVLRAGGGPQAGFRPYLLVSLRRTLGGARASGSTGGSTSGPAGGSPGFDPAEPFVDAALRGLEANVTARAFLSLPERWQVVLWHAEVEAARPAAVAPLLGLSANGVAALAYRAREGLRQAYLQLHLAESARRPCRPALDKLGGYLRGGLADRDSVRVERHLAGCARCAATYAELADVRATLQAIVAPLVLGTAAAGYLAAGPEARGDAGGAGGGDRGGARRAWLRLPLRQRRPHDAGTAGSR